ncbi:hypothetical protein U1Q18_022426 [Sarracenia purpurea var. burkii]
MVNDLPLNLRSRHFGSEVVKSFEEHVKEASFDSARRASLEEHVYCLKGLSLIQIVEGLILTFRPLTSSRAAISLVSRKPIEIQGEVKEKIKEKMEKYQRGTIESSSTIVTSQALGNHFGFDSLESIRDEVRTTKSDCDLEGSGETEESTEGISS